MANKRGQVSNLGSQLDAQLMATPSRRDESTDRAGDLRAAKRQDNQDYDKASGAKAAPMPGEQPSSLREAVMDEKRQKAAKEKEGDGAGSGKAASSARKGTSALLRQAWINLIPSYGLTLIWINIHVFLGMILGNNLFCKLGVEWSDKAAGATAKSAAMKKKLEDKASGSIGLVEKMGVGCADLGCIFILIAAIAIVALLIKVVSNPIDFFTTAIGWIWNEVTSGVGKVSGQ